MRQPLALVIDDEPDICELLTLTLGRMDIRTETAMDVAGAKSLLGKQRFDICLTDMRLPDGDGLELVEWMQQHAAGVPVAVITAHGNVETAVQALKLGAFDFISKPLDLGNLRTIVENALKVRSPADDGESTPSLWSLEMFTELLQTIIIPFGLRALLALLVLFIGRWLAGHIQRWVTASLHRTGLTASFVTLLTALSYYGTLILTGLVMLAVLGVPTATLAAIVGVVVVVLAISLQQSLGNLAATIIFLLFKPFEIGDVIETGGVLGVVQEMQMFSTTLIAPDGKTHILPNGKIQGGGLTNYSKTDSLRLNLTFDISYSSDIDQAKEIVMKLLETDERVLAEPAARVFVHQLAESSVQLVAWPFVQLEDYLTFQTDFVEQVKKAFDQADIVIPFPQRDVHLITESKND